MILCIAIYGVVASGGGATRRVALRAFLGGERSHFRIAQHIFPLATYGEGVADRPGGEVMGAPPATRLIPKINIVIIFEVRIIIAFIRITPRICSVIVV